MTVLGTAKPPVLGTEKPFVLGTKKPQFRLDIFAIIIEHPRDDEVVGVEAIEVDPETTDNDRYVIGVIRRS